MSNDQVYTVVCPTITRSGNFGIMLADLIFRNGCPILVEKWDDPERKQFPEQMLPLDPRLLVKEDNDIPGEIYYRYRSQIQV